MSACGMRVVWEKGPRTTRSAKQPGGRETMMTGKNGGPIIHQLVVKRYVPKERRGA